MESNIVTSMVNRPYYYLIFSAHKFNFQTFGLETEIKHLYVNWGCNGKLVSSLQNPSVFV
jgi:hypothetical protein